MTLESHGIGIGCQESAAMEIRISKDSRVSVRRQLVDQISFLIATGEIKPGQAMPSVREMARRLDIHHNTVSEAYGDLVKRSWLFGRRGARLLALSQEEAVPPRLAKDMDDFINNTIRIGRELGYSLQVIRKRAQERLLAQPPDHILVVEREAGLRSLIREEIRQALGWPTSDCSREYLFEDRGMNIGALVAVPQYATTDVAPLVPKDRPAVPIRFGVADEHIERIRKLRKPSIIAVVSVSPTFLQTAGSLLASAIGRKHSVSEFLLRDKQLDGLRAADLVFCDSIAIRSVRHPGRVHYQIVARESMEYLGSAMQSYHS
jgi:DNA-binding transcriptional regulator YhcF (GntR family)